MAQQSKRYKKKPAKKKVRCVWCNEHHVLDSGGRFPDHQSKESKEHWPYEHVPPSRCPGSGAKPDNWKPRPVTTHPQAKKKKRIKKRKVNR